ncbi:hypothetical protein M885DRAFT_520499 [Pelagophyceae sp. CCMP2097]|nr:hypothetical protein M885DRAFT_520499 [Pelagophyceae sp. CCMP2097]
MLRRSSKSGVDDVGSQTNQFKSFLLFGLLITDLLLNASLEYDDFDSFAIMFGVRCFVQLCAFVTVFLMLCETYPFRVGLIDALLVEFRPVLWLHPLYFFYSTLLGLFYMIDFPYISGNRQSFRGKLRQWDSASNAGLRYICVSLIHKLVAAFYYFANVRAAVRLGDRIYYVKDSWVSLFHRTGGSQVELKKLLQKRQHNADEFADDLVFQFDEPRRR